MTNEIIKILLTELTDELKAKYQNYKGLYFFGSRASHTHCPESDLDLVITFDRIIDKKFKDEIRDFIYEFDLKYNVVIDSHIYNYDDINKPITPFRQSVKTGGIYYGV